MPLYVVHVMSSGAAALVAAARAAGQRVIGEAIASGIAAYEASIFSPDFKVSPAPASPPFCVQLDCRKSTPDVKVVSPGYSQLEA